MAWRCCAETSGVLGLFVNPTIFFTYLCVMQSFGKREYLSSFFIPAQAGIFSPAEDDVVTARSPGAWESVVILQHPRAGSSWPGCGWWSNLVRTCYNILGDQDGDISSNTEQQPGMLRVPRAAGARVHISCDISTQHLTTAATHLLYTIHHHQGRTRQSSAEWC